MQSHGAIISGDDTPWCGGLESEAHNAVTEPYKNVHHRLHVYEVLKAH